MVAEEKKKKKKRKQQLVLLREEEIVSETFPELLVQDAKVPELRGLAP